MAEPVAPSLENKSMDEPEEQPAISIPITFDVMCSKLKIKKETVLAAGIVGSYLWGYASAGSDVDVLVIVNDDSAHPSLSRSGCGKASIHGSGVDAIVWTKEVFAVALRHCEFLPCVFCTLPEPFILKALEGVSFKLDLQRLGRSVIEEHERDMQRIEKWYDPLPLYVYK